jgi:hypothetical protein
MGASPFLALTAQRASGGIEGHPKGRRRVFDAATGVTARSSFKDHAHSIDAT